jgi:hypothetical protein
MAVMGSVGIITSLAMAAAFIAATNFGSTRVRVRAPRKTRNTS